MNAEKVELVEDRHEQRNASEIERMLGEGDPRRVAVGEGEEDPDLVGRPDRHAVPNPRMIPSRFWLRNRKAPFFWSLGNLAWYLKRFP